MLLAERVLALGCLFALLSRATACTCSSARHYCKSGGWCCGDDETCNDFGTGSSCGERWGSDCTEGNSGAAWLSVTSDCYDSSSSGAGSCTSRQPLFYGNPFSNWGKYYGCCCNAGGAIVTDGHGAAGADVCVSSAASSSSGGSSTSGTQGCVGVGCSFATDSGSSISGQSSDTGVVVQSSTVTHANPGSPGVRTRTHRAQAGPQMASARAIRPTCWIRVLSLAGSAQASVCTATPTVRRHSPKCSPGSGAKLRTTTRAACPLEP